MPETLDRETKRREATRPGVIRPPVRVPPREERRPIVRWIQWSSLITVLAVVVVAAFMLTRGGEEIESTLVPLGDRYTDPNFDVGPRFVGESGLTLEQMEELTTAPLVPLGTRYTDPNFDVGNRFAGESDLTLEEQTSLAALMEMTIRVDGARWNAILESYGFPAALRADAQRLTEMAEAYAAAEAAAVAAGRQVIAADAARWNAAADSFGYTSAMRADAARWNGLAEQHGWTAEMRAAAAAVPAEDILKAYFG